MKELERRLIKIRGKGYEQIEIVQVLNWIQEIKRDNAVKRFKQR